MARYIDADAVEKQIVDYYDAQLQSFPSSRGEGKRLLLGGINYGRNVVRDAPTADVVPKSEVEKVFEDIEKCLISSSALPDCCRLADMDKIAELKKKYTEERE